MHPLSAHNILQVWERGYDQHLVNRALTLLTATCQEMTWNELAELSVGQRDALLLFLTRCATFLEISSKKDIVRKRITLNLTSYMKKT